MTNTVELKLSEEQKAFLEHYGIHDVERLHKIPGEKLHSYMIYNDAYTDIDYLIFFDDYDGGDDQQQKKYLYYMGAENEAELLARHLDITIYHEIDSSRLMRYIDS